MDHPVLLVHGLASSFEHNWRATGWVDILADDGRAALAVDLPGHGTNSAQDPAAVCPAAAVLAALGDHAEVDAVGFSAGGHALLAAVLAAPRRFRRIALLGVGDPPPPRVREGLPPIDIPNEGVLRLIRALESDAEPDDTAEPGDTAEPDATVGRVLRRLALRAGNDPRGVAAYLRASPPPVPLASLATISLPVLVVLGEHDFARPADRLLAALPDARLVTLAGVDHFGTPADYRCIEAVTRFLAGQRLPGS